MIKVCANAKTCVGREIVAFKRKSLYSLFEKKRKKVKRKERQKKKKRKERRKDKTKERKG